MMHRMLAMFVLITISIGVYATDWYLSGPGGHAGERIFINGPSKSGWTLAVNHDGDSEFRKLYKDGMLHSISHIGRINGNIVFCEEQNAEGVLINRVEYAYDALGILRSTYITAGKNDDSKTYVGHRSFLQPDGEFERREFGNGENWTITELRDSNRTIEQASFFEGQQTDAKNWFLTEEGRVIKFVHSVEGVDYISLYNTEGYLVEERTERDGIVHLSRLHIWEDGKPVRIEERGDGKTVVWQSKWDSERKVWEEHLINGQKHTETEWISENERIQTFFRNGTVSIRIYWSDERRQKIEFFRNGNIFKTEEP